MAEFSIDLDGIWYAATACWFVQAGAKLFQQD